MAHRFPHTAPLPLLLATVFLLTGCARSNPYLRGYSGETRAQLEEEAQVRVFGVNREDPLAMNVFEFAHQDAMADHTLLGTATIISARSLRDAAAAQAAREIGADVVLYNFAYMNSTVETDYDTHYHNRKHDDHYHHDRHTTRTDRTRHWYEYRAFFFQTSE